MRWVEIINVRLAATAEILELERLFSDIRKSDRTGTEEDVKMIIYRGRFIDSDWAIHLHRETDEKPPGRTGLGRKLADIIRPMALVDHSIWIEEELRD